MFLCSQSHPAVLTRLLKGLNGRKVVLLTETDAVLGAELLAARMGGEPLPIEASLARLLFWSRWKTPALNLRRVSHLKNPCAMRVMNLKKPTSNFTCTAKAAP